MIGERPKKRLEGGICPAGWPAVFLGLALAVAPVGSADCGLNPANPGLPPANAYGQTGIPGDNVSAMCVDCHTDAPKDGMTSHFVSGTTRRTNDQATKERTAIWTTTGRASKYGNFSTWKSDNTTTGELICESCHSLVRNVAGGNNLLEESFQWSVRPAQPNDLNSPSTNLCEGCHTAATLSPTPGLPGKHPMTGDTLSSGTTLSTAGSAFTRAFVDNVTQMGGVGSDVRYPAANTLPCLSCHGNGHTGYTLTGARILRRGYSRDPASVGSGVVGAGVTQTDRQFDLEPNRLIRNYTPLCDACHTAND